LGLSKSPILDTGCSMLDPPPTRIVVVISFFIFILVLVRVCATQEKRARPSFVFPDTEETRWSSRDLANPPPLVSAKQRQFEGPFNSWMPSNPKLGFTREEVGSRHDLQPNDA